MITGLLEREVGVVETYPRSNALQVRGLQEQMDESMTEPTEDGEVLPDIVGLVSVDMVDVDTSTPVIRNPADFARMPTFFVGLDSSFPVKGTDVAKFGDLSGNFGLTSSQPDLVGISNVSVSLAVRQPFNEWVVTHGAESSAFLSFPPSFLMSGHTVKTKSASPFSFLGGKTSTECTEASCFTSCLENSVHVDAEELCGLGLGASLFVNPKDGLLVGGLIFRHDVSVPTDLTLTQGEI